MRTVGARALVAATVLAAGALGAGTSQGAAGARPAAAVEQGAIEQGAVEQGPVEQGAVGQAAETALQADDSCDLTASLPPAKNVGAKIKKIRERGTLVVGVDQNSYNWGYRDPQTGRIEGFDIDLARAVAKSILGDPNKVTLKAVPTARRIDAIKAGEIDVVVRTMTINCDRKKEIAFSTPYFRIAQQATVKGSSTAKTFVEALRGKRVCVAENSSTHLELKRDSRGAAEIRPVENQLDCLVLMQLNEVDTVFTDTALAASQLAQDRSMRLIEETVLPGYFGIGMNQADTDLVAWVNQVLAEWRADGGWRASYDHWLAPTMGSPERYLP